MVMVRIPFGHRMTKEEAREKPRSWVRAQLVGVASGMLIARSGGPRLLAILNSAPENLEHKYLFEVLISILVAKSPELGWLHHRVVLCLMLWGASIPLSIAAAPFYIPANCVHGKIHLLLTGLILHKGHSLNKVGYWLDDDAISNGDDNGNNDDEMMLLFLSHISEYWTGPLSAWTAPLCKFRSGDPSSTWHSPTPRCAAIWTECQPDVSPLTLSPHAPLLPHAVAPM